MVDQPELQVKINPQIHLKDLKNTHKANQRHHSVTVDTINRSISALLSLPADIMPRATLIGVYRSLNDLQIETLIKHLTTFAETKQLRDEQLEVALPAHVFLGMVKNDYEVVRTEVAELATSWSGSARVIWEKLGNELSMWLSEIAAREKGMGDEDEMAWLSHLTMVRERERSLGTGDVQAVDVVGGEKKLENESEKGMGFGSETSSTAVVVDDGEGLNKEEMGKADMSKEEMSQDDKVKDDMSKADLNKDDTSREDVSNVTVAAVTQDAGSIDTLVKREDHQSGLETIEEVQSTVAHGHDAKEGEIIDLTAD